MNVPTQVDQAIVRSNALTTIIVTAVVAATGWWPLAAFMAADFAIRGFLNPRWSAVSQLSIHVISRVAPFEHRAIYFPPKRFAARVGMVFSMAITALLVAGAVPAAVGVALTLVVFAALECFLNICMGCIVYNAFVGLMRRASR